MSQDKKYNWIEENFKDRIIMRYPMKRTLFSEKSPFQQVDVVETDGFGNMLLNDNYVMITERDEFIYHEMIAHVPLFVHPEPKKVLVIGGGDGGTIREAIRHPSVEHCDLVEIDGAVIEACKKFIPLTASALDNSRVSVHVEDGVKFARQCPANTYDVIMVDSTDPIGPSEPLFGPDFYKNIHRILKRDGIVVSQAESLFYELDTQHAL